MRYGKFALYLIVTFGMTFIFASVLGPLGRAVNVFFSFAAAGVVVLVARRILN